MSPPIQKFVPNQLKFSSNENGAISAEIDRLLLIGAISRCSHEKNEFISNIFTRVKSNGKIRIILNLKSLNEFLVYTHFKMEHLNFVLELVRNNDWFCSLDLADAYFSVCIAQDHWKFLKFMWNGVLFQYRVLVFGLAQAPYVFTRLCKPILALLRGKFLMRCSLYIDDMIIMDFSKAELLKKVTIAHDLFTSLGFEINRDKSNLMPLQQSRHLGFLIDSTSLCLSVPHTKIDVIIEKCILLRNCSDHIKIRNVASIIGTLIACCPGSTYGRLFYRNLERNKLIALRLNREL